MPNDRTMTIQLPDNLIIQIANALQREAPPRPPRFLDSVWQDILASRWAHAYQIADLAEAMDDRFYRIDLQTLAEAAGYPFRYIRSRPRFATADWLADRKMLAMDVAAFFIFLEHLGFRVDPAPMVQSVVQDLRGLSYMTLPEAEVYMFTKQRLRKEVHLQSEVTALDMPEERNWRSHSGYRFRAVARGDEYVFLSVRGPKFRPAVRQWTTCDVCGDSYNKGDPESALGHRRSHQRVMRLMSPRSLSSMRERIAQLGPAAAERVGSNAPAWLYKEVYERAVLFKREFAYDFVQWPASGGRAPRDPYWIGYVFTAEDGAIDGACAFYLADSEWSLHWVWVRPEKRRCGLLSKRWPGFLREFGDFWIEHPLSEAMVSFVARHASDAQRRRIAEVYPNGSPIEYPAAHG